jgi:hypothetical protein
LVDHCGVAGLHVTTAIAFVISAKFMRNGASAETRTTTQTRRYALIGVALLAVMLVRHYDRRQEMPGKTDEALA